LRGSTYFKLRSRLLRINDLTVKFKMSARTTQVPQLKLIYLRNSHSHF
jgi:hypothetical protein